MGLPVDGVLDLAYGSHVFASARSDTEKDRHMWEICRHRFILTVPKTVIDLEGSSDVNECFECTHLLGWT